MKDWSGSLDRDPAGLNLEGPIYISIDIDALDPHLRRVSLTTNQAA